MSSKGETWKTHKLHVQQPYLDLIIAGKKKAEVRAGKAENEIVENDLIEFVDNLESPTKKCIRRVTQIVQGKSFEEVLTSVGLENALPGVLNMEAALAIYNSFPGYTERAAKYGVFVLLLGEPAVS